MFDQFLGLRTNPRLWIDAICINQSDADEKSQQVRMMTEIYARASLTFVWVGEEDVMIDRHAISLLDKDNEIFRYRDPYIVVTKGRPRNQGGPFSNEPAFPPSEPARPSGSSNNPALIRRSVRRNYSQFETLGPSLEAQDEADEQDGYTAGTSRGIHVRGIYVRDRDRGKGRS